LRHDGLLHEITEGRMRGKPTRGRRIQMLHDLAIDGGFAALKLAAEDRQGWRHRERMLMMFIIIKFTRSFLQQSSSSCRKQWLHDYRPYNKVS